MANQIIRPDDLPPRANPVASEVVPSDNGSIVGGVTWADGVNAGRPLASQNEAEAGVNATKAMTPLTTKQAIDAQAITGLTAGDNITISGPANNPVIDATAELNSGDKGDVSVITPTSEWRINRKFDTVAALLADDGSGPTGMGYAGSGAPVTVEAGNRVVADDFPYEVAASGATDHHVETANGVKLYVLPQDGIVSPMQFGAVGDGVTNDTTKLASMFNAALGDVDLSGRSYLYSTLSIASSVSISNGELLSAATSGTQITVAPTARLKARRVKFIGGGSENTYTAGHYIIYQVATSTSDRGVGMDIEGCEFSGCGNVCIWSQFCDGHRFVNNKFSNFAYGGFMVLSCNNGLAQGNRIECLDAVGSSSNAYGLAITHNNTNYNLDPNAGTQQAANPFSRGWVVDGNTIVGSKIWTGLDFHGGYNNIVVNNKVYGTRIGIMLGTGSNDAQNYAGYNTIIANNLVTTANEDGLPVSGLVNPLYGIAVSGGSVSPHHNIIVDGNIVEGFGGGGSVDVPAIRVNTYAENFIVANNVIDKWLGRGVQVSTGAGSGVISNNVFSGMRDTLANSSAIRFEGTAPGRYQLIGNVLAAGGTQAPYGLLIASAVTGHITYGSDLREASTEVAGAPTGGGSLRQVSYA